MRVFDLETNPSLLESLRNDVIMVGLNFSRLERNRQAFGNFHDPYHAANDFKIRYAFRNTEYYGAYMTDIIKNLTTLNAKDAVTQLKTHPEMVQVNISSFRQELQDLRCHAPLILAFGKDAFRIIDKNLERDEYSRLVGLTHYSHQISKEKYRDAILKQIGNGNHPIGLEICH